MRAGRREEVGAGRGDHDGEPGKVAIHHASRKIVAAVGEHIAQVGVGGWTPRARKPSAASRMIMRATSRSEHQRRAHRCGQRDAATG